MGQDESERDAEWEGERKSILYLPTGPANASQLTIPRPTHGLPMHTFTCLTSKYVTSEVYGKRASEEGECGSRRRNGKVAAAYQVFFKSCIPLSLAHLYLRDLTVYVTKDDEARTREQQDHETRKWKGKRKVSQVFFKSFITLFLAHLYLFDLIVHVTSLVEERGAWTARILREWEGKSRVHQMFLKFYILHFLAYLYLSDLIVFVTREDEVRTRG